MDLSLIAVSDLLAPALAGGSAEAAAALLFAFLVGHALADFPLQGSFLAIGKERHGDLEKLTGTAWPRGVWSYCLTMHSLIHAGAVWLISGSSTLGFVEFGLHWLIDFAKSSRWTNFYLDQALHVACKVGYVFFLLH